MSLSKTQLRLNAFRTEHRLAIECLTGGDLTGAFHHAERAHVLGQPWALHHTRAHWLMLKIGLRRRDAREVWGQIIRLAAGGLLTIIGRAPEGNTGGANVSPEKPMPLPPDLRAVCAPAPETDKAPTLQK